MVEGRTFEDWTDEELVSEILKSTGPERTAHLDALFWRFFDKFETNIRAVLRSHGIAYADDETHYNLVFDGIYQRLFGPPNFRKIASKFDAGRCPSFRGWFLGRVKRDRIRDWLRSSNREQGMTNRTYLIFKYPVRSLSRPGTRDEDWAIRDAGSPDRAHAIQEEGGLEGYLKGLRPGDRILMKLLYCGTSPITEAETAYLAKVRGSSREEVIEALAAYETSFRQRYEGDLEKAREIDGELGTRHFLARQNEKRIHLKLEEIQALGVSENEIARSREESEGRKILELAREIKDRDHEYQEGLLSPEEYRKRVAMLELMEFWVRERKLRRKIDDLHEQLDRLFSPVNHAVSEILEMNQKHFSHRKKTILARLRKQPVLSEDREK